VMRYRVITTARSVITGATAARFASAGWEVAGAGPGLLPATLPLLAGCPGEASGSCGGTVAPNETLTSVTHKACQCKQFHENLEFVCACRGFSTPALQSSSYPSFPARGKVRDRAFGPAQASHSVPVAAVRPGVVLSHPVPVFPVGMGVGVSHSVPAVLGAIQGRARTSRSGSSRSGSRAVRVRRAALIPGAGARVEPGCRMRRKAVTTCNAKQEAYSSRSWRCSR
jgi:hypothetical protein